MRSACRILGRRNKKLKAAYHFSAVGGWADEKYNCVYCKRNKLFLQRQCNDPEAESLRHQLLPFGPQPKPTPWWPVYRFGTAPRIETVNLHGFMLTECPRSYITGISSERATKYRLAKRTNRQLGDLFTDAENPDPEAWTEDVTDILSLEDTELQWVRDSQRARSTP